MTVIATFHHSEYPMVFSDLLLSGYEREGIRSGLPTIGDVRNFYPQGSGWTITGLAQKIAIVSDDCVVAWAGSQLGAQFAIEELRQIAETRQLTPKLVSDFLVNLNVDMRNLSTSLIGFIRSKDGFIHFSHEPDLDFRLQDGTPVCAAGSGAEHLKSFLGTSRRSRVGGKASNVHPAQLAFEHGLQLGGAFLREENVLGNTLLQFFGGGYEVAVFNGERFTKDRGVTYVFWELREPDSKGFASPTLVVTHEYKEDVLFIRSQEFVCKGARQYDIGAIQIYVISPVYRKAKLSSAPKPEDIAETTPWICHCVLFERQGRICHLAMVDRWLQDGSAKVSFEMQQGVILKVNTKKEFWHDLQAAVDAQNPPER